MISTDLKRTPWFLLLFAISLLLLLGVAFGAKAADDTFYDAFGRRAGSATTHGGTTTFYDEFGRRAGSATTNGGTTTFYDQFGRQAGSATNRERGNKR